MWAAGKQTATQQIQIILFNLFLFFLSNLYIFNQILFKAEMVSYPVLIFVKSKG